MVDKHILLCISFHTWKLSSENVNHLNQTPGVFFFIIIIMFIWYIVYLHIWYTLWYKLIKFWSSKGRQPESNSKRITPHDQTSAAAPSYPLLISSCTWGSIRVTETTTHVCYKISHKLSYLRCHVGGGSTLCVQDIIRLPMYPNLTINKRRLTIELMMRFSKKSATFFSALNPKSDILRFPSLSRSKFSGCCYAMPGVQVRFQNLVSNRERRLILELTFRSRW